MDQERLKQIQNQYYDDGEYVEENDYDELLQENTEDLEPDSESVLVQNGKGAKSKINSLITQVDKGSSQPKYQEKDDIPGDFFVEDEIVIGPQRGADKGKKTLALDLDETLVHSSFQPIEGADLILPVEIDGQCCEVYVMKRPGVDEFLKRLHKHYELIIYTASLSKYADPLLDWLDPKNYNAYRLFREHCTYFNGIFVKDLSRLDRPLKDCMIIDNSPTSYLFHPECAIPTVSWYDDQSDMELYQLCSILEKISGVDDVRPVLKQFISDNKVDFEKASQVLDRPDSATQNQSPSSNLSATRNGPVKVKHLYTKDERHPNTNLDNQNEARTTDERNKFGPSMLTNTWSPNNTNLEEQFKKFSMMNQYKQMGLNNMNPEWQKMLSNTLSSYNPGGRNHLKEQRRSSKKNKTRQHSANQKLNISKRRKSPSRGRNDANTIFMNLMKHSLKGSKSKHKKKKSNANVSKGHDSNIINSIMPQTMSHINKKTNSKKPRASNTPKRGIRYANMFGRKGGSTRVSRKGSAANSNERGAYSTYVSHRVSPKSKKKQPSMDYNSNTNSFSNMMMKDMGVSFNYGNFKPRYGARSRQGMGSKKSSLIDNTNANSNKARAVKMYSSGNIHTPTPGNATGVFNDSKIGGEIVMMNANNNHQHAYKLMSTGRGKTPHQKPGSPKRRKHSGSKRSHSRPRSSKHGMQSKTTNFQAKFFDPKQLLNGYNS
jgi:RNA polymerase II subunit A small phosphatase-like protein